MKPMIKYRGGKSKEIPNIMWYVPRFSGRYIEPFLGGGALYFYLEPRQAIINDINIKLIDFYKGVRNNFPLLRKELDTLENIYTCNRTEFEAMKALHPEERVIDKNETLYYKIRDMFNNLAKKEYSDAALYYFINKTAYSGMIRYNAKGEFNVPYGRYTHLNTDIVTLSHSKLLQRSQIFNTDYSDVFNMCEADDFIFLDPPYDCIFSDYGNEAYRNGFNEDCHRKLAQDFKNLPCKAMMVVGRTPLTSSLYNGLIVDEYKKNYAVNIRNRFKAAATHIIITNYKKDWDNIHVYSPHKEYQEAETMQIRLFEKRPKYGKN